MLRFSRVLVPMLIAGAAIAVACGGDSKTVKIPGGGEISASDKLPGSFPKDYPVYGGAKVLGSVSGTSEGITGATVTWETGDSLEKVTDFYEKAFGGGAWKSDSNGQIGESSFWAGESSDGKKAHYLLASSQDGKTSIIVTLGDNPNNDSSSSSDSKTSTSGSSSTPDGGSSEDSSTPEPATLPAEVKISKDFPSDRVPLPSGARVTSSSSFGGGGTQTFSIELFIKDTPENVADSFASALEGKGWTNAFSSNSNGEYLVTFSSESEDGATAESVTVSTAESEVKDYARVNVLVNVVTN